MVQASGGAVRDMPVRRQLLDKIDRFKDLHRHLRQPLKLAVSAVLDAYEEDKDDLELQSPSVGSFKGMLRFLSHPHWDDWMIPSIALSPEGNFVAIWDASTNRYTVEFLDVDAAHWVGVIREYDSVRIMEGDYTRFDDIGAPPFTLPKRPNY